MDRFCRWCEYPLPSGCRTDAKFCDVRCRQSFFRFARGRGIRPGAKRPLKVGYADPPYPGKSRLYKGHRDYAGEVDHFALVCRLENEFPDGWALSTSAAALGEVLRRCPERVRVAAWFRGERATVSYSPLSAWEPVLYSGGRARKSSATDRRTDALVFVSRPRRSDPRRVIGSKPSQFAFWLFDLLGLLPGDDFMDLFPGSGRMVDAWKVFGRRHA